VYVLSFSLFLVALVRNFDSITWLTLPPLDYYYYGTAGGRRFWWKQHVTTMQISQFVIDLSIVYYASFQLFSHRYHNTHPYSSFLPATKDCAGSENAALLGCGLLSSYLVLFIQFFIATYIKGKRGAKRGPRENGGARANGVANGHAKANGMANGNAMANGMNGHANGNGVA
jgi:fatty acid elongase 3